jgi:hypothetical protein
MLGMWIAHIKYRTEDDTNFAVAKALRAETTS